MDLEVSLPEELNNLKLPDPSLLTFYKNSNDRIISLDCEIDEVSLELEKIIIRWNKEDKDKPVEERTPIKIWIFSPGGSLDVCFSLISIIKASKTPIYTYNMGMAMSAAFMILIAGHKRYCLQRSTAMVHKGAAATSGTADQVMDFGKLYTKMLTEMKKFVLENTKITSALFSRRSKNDWYIDANEQLELGVVDEIIDDIDKLY